MRAADFRDRFNQGIEEVTRFLDLLEPRIGSWLTNQAVSIGWDVDKAVIWVFLDWVPRPNRGIVADAVKTTMRELGTPPADDALDFWWSPRLSVHLKTAEETEEEGR